ncbi:ABC transporter substrate-binding protein [Maritimibacter sp. HL-12]|uniref:ABC transporter substrate-binding protein n=1 Tax=Maritimibacter sp. HL-12 TaxID=1162418 RepID=UPI000A0F0B2F|nr:ABC transporter substrate-binding protein [Maritimibacter sp. HL-12]SMH37966.1 trehalose/maltose transport system substrate-binding protein [Maritimibacter sp. HL-12]
MTQYLKSLAGAALVSLAAFSVQAETLNIVHGAVGMDDEILRRQLDAFEAATGHTVNIVSMPESTTDQFSQYKLWLSAQSSDIDVYRLDVIWAPQISEHFVDMNEAVEDIRDQFVPSALDAQTVDGKLVAMPMFMGAPALYYRADLLEKHGKSVPTTWEELTATAAEVMEAERAEGNGDMWGFVFQGAAYEGLTCNAMEWVGAMGGGMIVGEDGSVGINNPQAAAAIDLAASWVGSIAPSGVLNYKEEDARGTFQSGNAVFMRNWNYAYALVTGDDSPVKDAVEVAPLPGGPGGAVATLGGAALGVSAYSEHPEVAIELVKFLVNFENQKMRAIDTSRPATITAIYDDAEVAEKMPFIPLWKPVLDGTTPRPAFSTKRKYNEVSAEFWTAVHNTMSGNGTAESNLAALEARLTRLKGDAW